MKIYLVGGAVRDQLLGLTPKERDWVVVGSSPEAMLAQGYQAVGKDFPVFLHPTTHEEYALARTERKTAQGYKGFAFYASPDVTLEEDLKRRDLTINAIAQDENGTLIDPYNGQNDLKEKIFRHVSPAFQEDPVRILRLARFASRFPDFACHAETVSFMKTMVENGEVNALVPERVWQEWERALCNEKPTRFFEVLDACEALPALFPEIKTQGKGFRALNHASALTPSADIRFAALLHDLNDSELTSLCNRYRVPNEYRDLALLVSRHLPQYLSIHDAEPNLILDFILATDVLRRRDRFSDFALACQACDDRITDEQHSSIVSLADAIQSIDIKPLQAQNLRGEDFARALKTLRLKVIQEAA